jgi:hypothetical protein
MQLASTASSIFGKYGFSALAVAERLVDFPRASRVNGIDLAVGDACLVAGIFEHCERLAAAKQHRVCALQLVAGKGRVGLVGGDEKAVHLVDLDEMHRRWRFPLRQWTKTLAEHQLNDMGRTVFQRLDRRHALWRDRSMRIKPLGFEKTAGHGRDQRRIER